MHHFDHTVGAGHDLPHEFVQMYPKRFFPIVGIRRGTKFCAPTGIVQSGTEVHDNAENFETGFMTITILFPLKTEF